MTCAPKEHAVVRHEGNLRCSTPLWPAMTLEKSDLARRQKRLGTTDLHEVSGELDKSAETSAMVAGWKKDSSGGLEAGGRCGEEVVVPDRIEVRSL